MNRKKVLLLGNGINRIDNDYAWEDLMRDLLTYSGLQDAISTANKPFPMLYEELYLRWRAQKKDAELVLKRKIRELLRKIGPNELHRRIGQLPMDEVMTTNYDYNLESVGIGGLREARYVQPVKGSKFSLLRRRQVGQQTVWHIHGEVAAPGTILLGYEHYAGYLQSIRNYVMTGTKYKDYEMSPLNQRLKSGDDRILSWIDHFFLSDVYILGLNMDFVEMHLWWLLDFRARLMFDKRYNIRNRITFIYPAHDTAWIKPRVDLLCATKVACLTVPVVDHDWKGMYHTALTYIQRHAEWKGH